MERQVKKTKLERRLTTIYWKRSEDNWLFYIKRSYPDGNFFLILPARFSIEVKAEMIGEYLNIDPEWITIERKFDRNRVKKYLKIK